MDKSAGMNAKAAEELRASALQAVKHQTAASLALAELLWATYYGSVDVGGKPVPLYEVWGFESWNEYVEDELEWHQSTAMKYVRVHQTFFISLDGEWDKKIGLPSITKLVALASVVKKNNVNSWLKKAHELTCCELDAEIKKHFFGLGTAKLHNFSAFVTQTELTDINAIIEVARQDFPKVERRGQIVRLVMEEWYKIRQAKGAKPKLKAVAGGKK
jgi:hypothetical protein